MLVSDIKYSLEIIAVKGDSRNYVIEVKQPGLKDVHYAVGPNNSVGNTVARIVNGLEIDNG